VSSHGLENSTWRQPDETIQWVMHAIQVAPLLGLREPFSALTHFFGAVVFLILAVRLVGWGKRRPLWSAGLAVLAWTTIQTLLVSSLYHASWPGPLRTFLLRADVAGIFCLIAASITPVHLILFRGPWRWCPLVFSWTAAILGVSYQLFAAPATSGGWTGTLLFLAFGWANVISAVKVWRVLGWRMIQGPVLAGLCYTLGAIVLLQHKLTILPGVIGPHELWHIAVLCALSLQWMFLFEMLEQVRKPELPATDKSADILPLTQPAIPARHAA